MHDFLQNPEDSLCILLQLILSDYKCSVLTTTAMSYLKEK